MGKVITFPLEKTSVAKRQRKEPGHVARLKQLQPGEVLDVVRTLRRLLVEVESAGYTLHAGFANIGGENLEENAEKTRRTLELATARAASLLEELEASPAYLNMKREVLARRSAERKASQEKESAS